MVALVHDDKRVKLVDDLEQCGFIRFFNGAVGLTQHLCKLGKVAVLLIGSSFIHDWKIVPISVINSIV